MLDFVYLENVFFLQGYQSALEHLKPFLCSSLVCNEAAADGGRERVVAKRLPSCLCVCVCLLRKEARGLCELVYVYMRVHASLVKLCIAV